MTNARLGSLSSPLGESRGAGSDGCIIVVGTAGASGAGCHPTSSSALSLTAEGGEGWGWGQLCYHH